MAELNIFYPGIKTLIEANRNMFINDYARTFKTIRDEEYKYIKASDERNELYNIVQDPGETRNVIEDHPEKAKELRSKLDDFLGSFDVPELKEEDETAVEQMDIETLEALKALGYVR